MRCGPCNTRTLQQGWSLMFFFEIRRSLSGAMDSRLEDLGGTLEGPWISSLGRDVLTPKENNKSLHLWEIG